MSTEQQVSTGSLPEDYVGAEDHGPGLSEETEAPTRAVRRQISSVVWGGVVRPISSEHGVSCGYCGHDWPVGVGMPPNTHPGMDISIVRGTKLYAAAAGKVVFAGWDPRHYRPHHVDIVTPNGQRHIYAHMWTVAPGITAGAQVARGQFLGTSGEQTKRGTMTPDGTGAHLHFEARRVSDGRALNPEPILTGGEQPKRGFSAGDRIRVDADELNFREQPSTSAKKIELLRKGTQLCVTGAARDAAGYTWYPARLQDARTGWLAGKFCSLVEAGACGFQVGDRVRVNVDSLRLRAEPGTGSQIVHSLPSGTELCVTGASRDTEGYRWYPVRTRGGDERTGWVAGTFCDLTEANGCSSDDGGEVVTPPGDRAMAEAIDRRIELSNRVNGRRSKLTGMGARFVALGKQYGIRPEIACAILQRESQMGADGSRLPEEFNNFGGITAGSSGQLPGPCGARFHRDRYWKVYCTPEEGLEGLFKLLDAPLYRNTGGRFLDIMKLYSPPGDGNPYPPEPNDIFSIFRTVGEQLGTRIELDTQIYTA